MQLGSKTITRVYIYIVSSNNIRVQRFNFMQNIMRYTYNLAKAFLSTATCIYYSVCMHMCVTTKLEVMRGTYSNHLQMHVEGTFACMHLLVP